MITGVYSVWVFTGGKNDYLSVKKREWDSVHWIEGLDEKKKERQSMCVIESKENKNRAPAECHEIHKITMKWMKKYS